MTQLHKDALAALEHLNKTISNFVQKYPHVRYSTDMLYGNSAKVMMDLRKALSTESAIAVAQEHGATVAVFKLGDLRIEDRTAPRMPPAWAVCDFFRNCLSKSGEMDDEPQPSSRTYEWLQEHRWPSAEEAIKAAADYLAKEGGAA